MLKLAITSLIVFISFVSFSQTAGFTYQAAGGSLCAPVTVNFSNTTTGTPTGFIWNFGNGQSSNQAAPSVLYSNTGTYTVKLVAVYDGSVSESVQTITINPGITASIAADRGYICQPGPIRFTATSSGNIGSYTWDFGDGSATVVTNGNAVTHNYTTLGNYTVKMRATDVSGCTASATYDVQVQKISITGSVSPTYGCIPVTVNFTAAANIPAGSTVSNYTWDFGDGTPLLPTVTGNSSHTYTTTGAFNPRVIITTSEGCANTYDFETIRFGTPPTGITASPDKLVYCGSETPVFTANATNADAYGWDFGDGTFETSSVNPMTHKYSTIGPKTVYVTPYFNGCAGASTSFNINIVGVIAGFDYSNTCSNKTRFQFTDTSKGVISSYDWRFTAGTSFSSMPNPSYTFPGIGPYGIKLIVSNASTGCADTSEVVINAGSAIFLNPDTSICRNSNTSFIAINGPGYTNAVYTWDVVGLPTTQTDTKNLSVKATVLGKFFNNRVIINNGPQYCPDTLLLSHPITVRGPSLYFADPLPICAGGYFKANNESKPFFPADTVSLWYWNEGLKAANDTAYQPPGKTYNSPGVYVIKLVAKDITGCVDSLTKPLVVDPAPFIQIVASKKLLCQGQPDTLIAYHSDSLLWSPAGAVPCATCDTIIVNPATNTQYIATAKNSYGCAVSDTVSVTVFTPFTASAAQASLYICQNDNTQVSVSPPGKIVTWSPATGLSSATIYNPIASPAATTVYTATLQDSASCFSSSAFVNVIVKTLPSVDAGPDRILPYNSAFTINPIYSNNASKYNWTPAINLSCVNCANPAGTALQEQQYVISVVSDSGCVATDSIKISIECKYANLLLPSAFTPNNDSRNDIYYPIARGIKTIKRFVIFNRMGQKMFEATDFSPNDRSAGWNGDFRGQKAEPGAYVYMLEATCETGNIITKKDSFILLR